MTDSAAPYPSITIRLPFPDYSPYHHTCRIPIASAIVRLTKSLLDQPSVGYPPPSEVIKGTISAPNTHIPSTVRILLQTAMITHLFFTNMFGRYGNKGGNYSRHSMLDFLLFMAVPSEDYYLSMKDRCQTLYVRSSCILKSLTVTDTIG